MIGVVAVSFATNRHSKNQSQHSYPNNADNQGTDQRAAGFTEGDPQTGSLFSYGRFNREVFSCGRCFCNRDGLRAWAAANAIAHWRTHPVGAAISWLLYFLVRCVEALSCNGCYFHFAKVSACRGMGSNQTLPPTCQIRLVSCIPVEIPLMAAPFAVVHRSISIASQLAQRRHPSSTTCFVHGISRNRVTSLPPIPNCSLYLSMFIIRQKFLFSTGLVLLILFLTYHVTSQNQRPPSWAGTWGDAKQGDSPKQGHKPDPQRLKDILNDEDYFWRRLPTHYPAKSMRSLPTGKPYRLPKVQTAFKKEDARARELRLTRRAAVQRSFVRGWEAYQKYAWLQDEVAPVSGSSRNHFGGWGATLVDSLDTLWIMGLHDEFEKAMSAAANINFEKASLEEINVFETTIRYLGGFLSAYDLSGDPRALLKAREVGDMLYVAFDTPNRMPITRWKIGNATEKQEAAEWALVAEVGSLCMEFTRLSLITGDPRWFDATERIMLALKDQQMKTYLPGMWPISINPRRMEFTGDTTFSLGAMADSVFEYLPKMVALTGGLLPHYKEMYEKAMKTAIKNNLFRPMTPDSADILVSGIVHTVEEDGRITKTLDGEGQHLSCFTGGMFTVGGKLFNNPEHLTVGQKLVDGCIWAYENMPSGIMPEVFWMLPCNSASESTRTCVWDKKKWEEAVLGRARLRDLAPSEAAAWQQRLSPGFIDIPDSRYILRPEAIESVFILYRATGNPALLEKAWAMFDAIERSTKSVLANSAIVDVTVSAENVEQIDSMESFWMGETLKYFYLIFSEPNLISLDEFVFNTEAHPFRRLVP